MSLINDALKRASQSQKARAAAPQPAPAPAAPPLQPVDYSQVPAAGSRPWLVPAVAVAILGLAAVSIWKWSQAGQPGGASDTAAAPEDSAPAASSVASAKPSPGESTAAHHLNLPSEIQVNTNPVARPNALPEHTMTANPRPAPTPPPAPAASLPPTAAPAVTAPAVAAAPPPKPQFPDLKLQGIFYRLHNPSVMINSQTLFKGDDIEGAKVIEIERQSVTVQFNGEKKELRMP